MEKGSRHTAESAGGMGLGRLEVLREQLQERKESWVYGRDGGCRSVGAVR